MLEETSDMLGLSTKEKSFLLQAAKPFIQPMYKKAAKEVKQWYANMNDSEFDHLLIGISVGSMLVITAIIVLTVRHERRKQSLRRQQEQQECNTLKIRYLLPHET